MINKPKCNCQKAEAIGVHFNKCQCPCHQAPEDKECLGCRTLPKDNPFHTCKEQEWAEFDKIYGEDPFSPTTMASDNFLIRKEELKKFLRQNFVSKREVEKKIKEWKERNKVYLTDEMDDLLNFIK